MFKYCDILFIACTMFFVCQIKAQDSAMYTTAVISEHRYDSVLHARQLKALDILSKEDTTTTPALWPGISPELFFVNVRKNVLYPDKIYQGKSTNFCGYAALTHLLLKYHPDLYVQYILSLYHSGKASLKKKTLKPSKEILQAAGTLKHKGDLDVLHADQLWFLTLADQFKGYMNFIDHHYNPGDENKIWAGTNYSKFNSMLTAFTDDKLTRRGSDLLRPSESNFYEYISGELQKGVVLLFVNSKYLYPHKYSFFKLRAPSHFIVAYNMYKTGDMIEFQYWDYGLRTEQQITSKRLRKLVFGVTTITHISNETN